MAYASWVHHPPLQKQKPNIHKMNKSIESQKEVRAALEIHIFALRQRRQRLAADETEALTLDARIDAAQNAYETVTSDRMVAFVNLLEPGAGKKDGFLIAALNEIENLESSRQDECATIARKALELYNEAIK
jgi:hypothetical protein